MSDERMRGDSNLVQKLQSVEKSLDALKERLDDTGKKRAELDNIGRRLPELKKRLAEIQEAHSLLEREVADVEKEIQAIDLKSVSTPIYVKIIDYVQQTWKRSKARFIIQIILLAMIAAIIYVAVTKRDELQPLVLEVGFFIVVAILMIAIPRYRQLSGIVLFSLLIAFVANFVDDESVRLTLVSIVIALVGLGLALQSFGSGETIENKLNMIDQKITGLLARADSVSKEDGSQVKDKSKP